MGWRGLFFVGVVGLFSAAGLHFIADGGEVIGREGLGGEGEDFGVFDVDVALVEGAEGFELGFEGGAGVGGEAAVGEPGLAGLFDGEVEFVGAAVVGFEGGDALECFAGGGGVALAESGEEGLFFVLGVAWGGDAEIAECGFEGAAVFVIEVIGGGVGGDAEEDFEEVFDAAVAVFEEAEGFVESGLAEGSEGDGHGRSSDGARSAG